MKKNMTLVFALVGVAAAGAAGLYFMTSRRDEDAAPTYAGPVIDEPTQAPVMGGIGLLNPAIPLTPARGSFGVGTAVDTAYGGLMDKWLNYGANNPAPDTTPPRTGFGVSYGGN